MFRSSVGRWRHLHSLSLQRYPVRSDILVPVYQSCPVYWPTNDYMYVLSNRIRYKKFSPPPLQYQVFSGPMLYKPGRIIYPVRVNKIAGSGFFRRLK